jgi:hypothetical protein
MGKMGPHADYDCGDFCYPVSELDRGSLSSNPKRVITIDDFRLTIDD